MCGCLLFFGSVLFFVGAAKETQRFLPNRTQGCIKLSLQTNDFANMVPQPYNLPTDFANQPKVRPQQKAMLPSHTCYLFLFCMPKNSQRFGYPIPRLVQKLMLPTNDFWFLSHTKCQRVWQTNVKLRSLVLSAQRVATRPGLCYLHGPDGALWPRRAERRRRDGGETAERRVRGVKTPREKRGGWMWFVNVAFSLLLIFLSFFPFLFFLLSFFPLSFFSFFFSPFFFPPLCCGCRLSFCGTCRCVHSSFGRGATRGLCVACQCCGELTRDHSSSP